MWTGKGQATLHMNFTQIHRGHKNSKSASCPLKKKFFETSWAYLISWFALKYSKSGYLTQRIWLLKTSIKVLVSETFTNMNSKCWMKGFDRVHLFRTNQNSLTFPWHKFKFPWQYWAQKYYEFSKKDVSGPNISASSCWNVKFPNVSLTFLQNYIFPWHITEFPDLEKI